VSAAAGAGIDRTRGDTRLLPRRRNRSLFGNVRVALTPEIDAGFEYTWLATQPGTGAERRNHHLDWRMPPFPARAAAASAVLVLLLAPRLAECGPVTGLVRTKTPPGVGPASAVVYAEPLDTPAPRRPAALTLAQRNRFHNVFSLSPPEPFDLGLYRSGTSRTRTFTKAGAYRVFCNIHPEMTAVVFIVPTPHVIVTGADGRYTLDLPPGRYRLTAVSDRAAPVSAEVSATPGAVTAPELVLDASGWVATQHKNKFGQDYPAAAYKR
jgi:hypothetical protein